MHCRAPRQALQLGSIADEHRCPGHNDAAPPTGTAAEETTNPTHRGNTLSLNPDKGRPYSRSEACTTEGVYYDASATSINANWQIDGAVNKLIIADEMRMGRRPRNANETRTSPTKVGDVEALIARPLGRRGSLSHRSCVPTRDAAVEMACDHRTVLVVFGLVPRSPPWGLQRISPLDRERSSIRLCSVMFSLSAEFSLR